MNKFVLLLGLLAAFAFAVAVPPDYTKVPPNFYTTIIQGSVPALQSFHWPVVHVGRAVNYGATAMFDATAKCLPNAFGPYTGNLYKRTPTEILDMTICGPQNKTVSQAYAYYVLATTAYPQVTAPLQGAMAFIGLDTSLATLSATDPSTDIGIGLISGYAVANFTFFDGMNQDGKLINDGSSLKTVSHNLLRFQDYTGISKTLENTAWDLKDCDRWQPLLEKDPITSTKSQVTESFTSQVLEAPQFRFSKVIGLSSFNSYIQNWPHMVASCRGYGPKYTAYLNQIFQVLDRGANLTDYTKMEAEHMEDKLNLFLYPWQTIRATTAGPVTGSTPWEADDDSYYLAVGDAAVYTAGSAAFAVKYYSRSIRPKAAIRDRMAGVPVTTWGGPGVGTTTIDGSEFDSHLRTMEHSGYPSATTCIGEAFSNATSNVIGMDTLPVPITRFFVAGSSFVEPGIVPAANLTLSWPSLSNYAFRAGESRLNTMVHFQADVDSARAKCGEFGQLAFNTMKGYLDGTLTTVLDPNDRDHWAPYDPLLHIKWNDAHP
jgi:hypothetical protein